MRAVRSVRLLALVALVAALFAVPWPAGAAESSERPRLRLLSAEKTVRAERYGEGPLYFDSGIYLASERSAFELVAHRSGDRVELVQVHRAADGSVAGRTRLGDDLVTDMGLGVDRFFVLTARNPKGKRVARTTAAFCPSMWQQGRLDDSGPDSPTYPFACGVRHISDAVVWGIDKGWGTVAFDPSSAGLELVDGTYDLTVRIAKRYRHLFDIPAAEARAKVRLEVTTFEEPFPEEFGIVGRSAHDEEAPATATPSGPMAEVVADASGLPDLIALAPWELTVEQIEPGQDQLSFAASVWNGGEGPLVVEGFRRNREPLMDAYQYFYRNGTKTGRAPVGTLEFDTRDGHRHWHFTDFARYRITDLAGDVVQRSGKEAFCLAPTDPIDLTLPNANWQPAVTGLTTSCGGTGAIWIREILDVGWGDTYSQSIPGQAFDITELANGDYLLEVTANPDGRLREVRTDNNSASLHFRLGGTPGARTVEVVS